ncbi:PAS domain S-box protein [Aquimarina sp. RZ0]|uniref:sensor histidine kinase n=1 Tax=Aquimarina sp. RZ0 TaxID=2607730 RepID=UPI0011F32034|nr:PAS domain-containing sensor histidine kinase [Aquimarina sp. RZ0]KAA1243310.1 PAS domain-containing sensor histidine kinase [Aquimarina sp. RZ0]
MNKTKSPEILTRALFREREARKQAEKILEDKSMELYRLTQELKKANAKLKKQVDQKNSELKGVFQNLVDAYVLMDVFGNVIEMNSAAVELFGYDISIESLNVMNLIYKEDYEYAITSFRKLITDGIFSDYQARVYTKKKGVRTVHINASIIFDQKNKPIAAQGIVRDITEELRGKEVFEEQKKQLSVIVENSSLGIVLSQYKKIIQTNKAFQNLIGYSKEELEQKEVIDISVRDEYESSSAFFEKLHRGIIDDFSINRRFVKKDGSKFWAKTSIAAVRTADGVLRYQVALVEDITEQLEAEKQNKELLLSLEKSNQELKDYAHIVSHDLKSPLRSINALVNWIKEDYNKELEGTGLDNIALIENTLEKMENLISGILNYSSAGNKNNLDTQKLNLNEIITDITDTIFIPKHVTVSIKNKLPYIYGDRTRIQQLFQNIISNAVNYIDKEEGKVDIDYQDKDSYYVFSIKDNGVGIKKEYHEKIFKIFQSLSDNKNSTGIGLSIVKKILDLYEGDIWLESKSGVGTTFYISLKK